MEHHPSRPTPPAASPSGPPTVYRPRPWIPLVLLLITFVTMTFAGSVLELTGEVGTLHELITIYLGQPSRILSGLPFAASLLAILGAHEMGHYLACRYYRIPATLPFFIPGPLTPFGTFGAVIRIRGIIPNPQALFDVAAAGPLAGYVVALPLLILGLMGATPAEPSPHPDAVISGQPLLMSLVLTRMIPLPEGVVNVDYRYVAGWFGMLVTSLNLFPVGQLDGGHVAYSVSRRFHRAATWLTLLLLALLVVGQPVLFTLAVFLPGVEPAFAPLSLYTLWLVFLLWMRDRHPRLHDESIPLGAGRRLLALLLLLMFLASFIPFPFIFIPLF